MLVAVAINEQSGRRSLVFRPSSSSTIASILSRCIAAFVAVPLDKRLRSDRGAIEKRSRSVEEESRCPLALRGGGLSSVSCYFVVVWRRVLLLLLHKEDADPPRCRTLLPSSVIEDECCPQVRDKSPPPPCLSRSKRQGGGQYVSFLKSICTQTCFTLSSLRLSPRSSPRPSPHRTRSKSARFHRQSPMKK